MTLLDLAPSSSLGLRRLLPMPVDKFGGTPDRIKYTPRVCGSKAFTELEDVEGWDKAGDADRVYGLRLLESGVYERAPVADAGAKRLIDLEDVAPEFKDVPDHMPVRLVRIQGRWEPELDEPDWDVKVSLRRPFTQTKPNHKVAKLESTGKILVSYVPTEKDTLEITGLSPFYAVTTKVGVKKIASLKAVTVLESDMPLLSKPPHRAVIYIELLLSNKPPVDWVSVLPGLMVKWTEPSLVGIVVRFLEEGRPPQVRRTDPKVEVKTDNNVAVDSIICGPHIGFVKLLYTTTGVVTDTYIELLANRNSITEAVLKKWLET